MSDTHRSLAEAKQCARCDATFFRDKRNTWKHWAKAKFCSRACSAQHQAVATKGRRGSMADEFSKWFEKGDGCWLWKGGFSGDGYGAFNYAGKTYRAPRVALELANGPIPEGMLACHDCDTPACVNPDHLYAGTQSDNVQDMIRRGRQSFWGRHP